MKKISVANEHQEYWKKKYYNQLWNEKYEEFLADKGSENPIKSYSTQYEEDLCYAVLQPINFRKQLEALIQGKIIDSIGRENSRYNFIASRTPYTGIGDNHTGLQNEESQIDLRAQSILFYEHAISFAERFDFNISRFYVSFHLYMYKDKSLNWIEFKNPKTGEGYEIIFNMRNKLIEIYSFTEDEKILVRRCRDFIKMLNSMKSTNKNTALFNRAKKALKTI